MLLERWLDELLIDVRFGIRTLAKTPGFSATAILTLALASGATTAIFSVVNGVLLRPLPFASPEQLVQITEVMPIGGAGAVIPQDIEEFRRQATTFEAFAGYGLTTRHIRTAAGSERLTAVVAQDTFFTVLGVNAVAGRTFQPGDRGQLVVISGRLWERRFNRDRSAVGQQLLLDGNAFDAKLGRTIVERKAFTIVGVMPDRFQFPYAAGSVYPSALPEAPTDLWILDDGARRGGRLNVTARLEPGASVAAAQAELNVIEQRLDQQAAANQYRPTGVVVTPLAEVVLGAIAPSLWLLVGSVGLVLAAACANVANLLLSQTAGRVREVVTRMALGAGRFRVVRQLLTESLVLSLAGGLGGAAVAWWGSRLLVSLGAARIPRSHEITLDWTVFAFLLAVCLATAFLFGLAPAIGAARADAGALSGRATGHASTGRGLSRMRDAIVVAEVVVAFVLAFGAASVVRELERLHRIDPGMATSNVVTLHLTPRVPDAEYFRIEDNVANLSGVEAAGLIHMVPLQNWGGVGTFQLRERAGDVTQMPMAELRSVTPGYFRVLGVPLKAGRGLNERDGSTVPQGIVINETLARVYFADTDPIGRELDRGTIVGVAGDVRGTNLDGAPLPRIYSTVNPSSGIAADIGMSLLVRTRGAPGPLIDAIRDAVHAINPALAIFNVRTMEQVVADSLWELNLYRWLIGLFATLALALAALGLYGVMSYSVRARSREFAVRLAVGSSPTRLARGVLGRGVTLTALGLLLGLAAAIGVGRIAPGLSSLAAPSPPTVALLVGAVLVLALASCLAPARRVIAVDPATTLRHE